MHTYQINLRRFASFINSIDNLVQRYIPQASKDQLPYPHTDYSLNLWNTPYYCPLPSCELYRIKKLDQLKAIPFVLVRDGLFTLVDFFNRFPNNHNVSTVFLIHSNYRNFIPERWHSNVLFFTFNLFRPEKEFNFKSDQKENIFFTLNLMEGVFNFQEIEKKLTEVKNESSIHLFLHLQEQNYFLTGQWDHQKKIFNNYGDLLNLIKSIEKQQKTDIKIAPFNEIYKIKDFSHSYFESLDQSQNYYFDSYSDYFFISQGARPRQALLQPKSTVELPFSYYHSLAIDEDCQTQGGFWQKLQKELELIDLIPSDPYAVSAFATINQIATEFYTGDSFFRENSN